MDILRTFHLHMISDATGETLVTIAKAVRVQYAQVRAIEHLHPLVRSRRELERVLKDVEAAPGTVPTAGPLVDPTVPGGTVWFCLTLSSKPISAIAGRHKFVKWYLASTSFWLTPCADCTAGQPSSDALGSCVR